jgi:hypothetical protein
VAANLHFNQANSREYTIMSQSLVGNTYIGCGASMAVSRNQNATAP